VGCSRKFGCREFSEVLGRQASQFLAIFSGIVAQPFYEVGELEAVDRDVLGVEVAGIDGARLQRNVSQGHHPPAVPDRL
jgi:hypothetical protein